MSMQWGDIHDLFLKTCGNSQDAPQEAWQHLNFMHRQLCASLELPELHIPDATEPTVKDQDYIDMDVDVYSIDWIVDKSTGRKIDPEPSGMRGRARYIETGQVRPPTGAIQFYQRSGNKIFLRDTPSAIVTLLISFRMHPPQIADADRSKYPITPHQFDMALLKGAAANFFELHPPINPDGSMDYGRAAMLKGAVVDDIAAHKNPTGEENLDRRQWTRQQGYEFSVWGR